MTFFAALLARLARRSARPVPLTLYTRPGCGLCQDMKAELARAALPRPYQLDEVDVDTDRKLKKLYGLRIPVLAIAGRVVAEGRLDPRELAGAFERLASEWDRAQRLARALGERG